MATLVLSAAGAAIGSGFGGAAFGLSGMVIGRAVGATLGRVIDQRLMGLGSEVVEQGRLDRLRLTGASEGAPVPRVWGRIRVGGHVIWATQFLETVSRRGGGGKGMGAKPKIDDYAYSISLAVALCEGPIAGIGRIWADGAEVSPADLNLRVYTGSDDQLPDPKIAAVQGLDAAPAYRGIAYVVFEDLALGPFGNRVPQFSFEVLRAAEAPDEVPLRAVALMPGTGEYALATDVVHQDRGLGAVSALNMATPLGVSNLVASVDALQVELPQVRSVLLIVSWFGDDLRAGQCSVAPMVEDAGADPAAMPWGVSGLMRADVGVLSQVDGRAMYGGTPADASVMQSIALMRDRGLGVVFYPFLLMRQMADNGLPDPWSDAGDQPVLPWRGRITTVKAPGQPGSTDGTAAAAAEVAAFFGTVAAGDFAIVDGAVVYSGPAETSYRRFILHYAWLCRAAGGVDAFCIGSEMRALTQIRGLGHSFPAVIALRALAADVRAILGAACKLTYAADWSEYFGYTDADGNRWFHLDPLWADENIDFIGIDNYMPLSDWREGDAHADAGAGAIYDLDYLRANVAGGEGYDWYYPTEADRAAQNRVPITDGAYDEPWIWRYKDILNWWSNPHHERVNGARAAEPTVWEPRSKPVWFTELGCAAVDKGTNQPNKFLDPKSSESSLPYFSTSARDDLIQMQYLRAMHSYWADPEVNPVSDVYGAPMVDMTRAHVWAWDARPFPWFPNDLSLWSDGENWTQGHWITGRTLNQPLALMVAEVCRRAGVTDIDVSNLHGLVRGYAVPSTLSPRAALQPLMLAHGFDAVERDGTLVFRMRDGRADGAVAPGALVARDGGALELIRAPQAEVAGRVRLGYVAAEGDYDARAAEAVFPDEATTTVTQSELPMVLTVPEAQGVAERWLAEARVARDTARFGLPPSSAFGVGDVVALNGARFRLDRVAVAGARQVEAVRVEPGVYARRARAGERPPVRPFAVPVPVLPVFLDLPLLRGDEVPHAPHLAVTGSPWPGVVAVFDSALEDDFALNTLINARATIGVTQTPLARARAGIWDRGAPLRVQVVGGDLSAVSRAEVLGGANAMAIGDGQVWEVFQFADAALIAPGVYDLSMRLRGQAGTDGVMPDVWPVGSQVVVLNAAPIQVTLPLSARGLARNWRVGPAQRGYDDPSYRAQTRAFDGVGLRPYAPVHLRAVDAGAGDLLISWVRRTRVDGDSWAGYEVPLAEGREAYEVRVIANGTVLRRAEVAVPSWTYTAAMRAADGPPAAFEIAVAQLSEAFGPGPFRRIAVAGGV